MSTYWLIFAVACAVCAVVPFASRWDDRRDERERDQFSRFYGGKR